MIDSYALASRYLFPIKSPKPRIELEMDPSKPYTNLLKIKDEIFSQLTGSVGIVDKHMNSTGIENLHRLIHDNLGNISEINILTSAEMLDGEFSRNYLDCKSEVEHSGARINVLVMSEADSSQQHERFLFDGTNAYKVPPFNIIHKKSEHITRINLSDASKRFDELYKGSTKYENYVLKNGRTK
jgi:hypothetical protein